MSDDFVTKLLREGMRDHLKERRYALGRKSGKEGPVQRFEKPSAETSQQMEVTRVQGH